MFERNKIVTYILIAYLLAIVIFMLVRNMSITPDRFFIILLFAAVIVGRTKSFLRDWVPFIALLLGYEMLRGFADIAGFPIHVADMVNLERSIFGFIPGVELQKFFFNPNHIAPWDILATIIDFLHFPLPLLVAFYLWIHDKKAYWKFVIALLFLSFSGFLTFLIFPAAPPWYAAQNDHLIHIYKIIDYVIAHYGAQWNISTIYHELNPNPVAAMPSLHSAYPWLAFLALRNFSKKIGYIFLVYPILVWISVVYLGEHYVIDVIAGIIYASSAYFVVYHQRQIRVWLKTIFTLLYKQGKVLRKAINEG